MQSGLLWLFENRKPPPGSESRSSQLSFIALQKYISERIDDTGRSGRYANVRYLSHWLVGTCFTKQDLYASDYTADSPETDNRVCVN